MSNINELYEAKLEEMKTKLLGGVITDKIKLRTISNKKIDEMILKMNDVIKPRKVWEDFNFRTGKILGILRSIAQNPTKRQELLEITGLTQTHIDIYFEVAGNLPFITNDGTINPGRPMDIELVKELIVLVSVHFGYVIEDADLSDITEERWYHLYNNALERCAETIQHNEENKQEMNITYDE